MPLTEKGRSILASMQEHYGSEKGEQVFYASRNAGKIEGVDMATKDVADPRIESINDEDPDDPYKDPDDMTDDAFLVPEKNKMKRIGDMDDPNMVGKNEETEDVKGVYSRGNSRGSALSNDKGVGKVPSFLKTKDSATTLRQMNNMNRRFWGNGRGQRGRGR